MFAGVRPDFRAVYRDRAHTRHAHLGDDDKHVQKHFLELSLKPLSEIGQRTMVGVSVAKLGVKTDIEPTQLAMKPKLIS